MTTLQTILVTTLLAIWLCFSLVFLITAIQSAIYDRKREKREKQQAVRDLEYHEKRMDLWAEFRLLDMGKRLGRFITNFRDAYFVPDKHNQQIVFSYKPKPGAEDAIYRLVSDITISMKSTDYLKMPECVINEVSVRLSAKEMECYKTLKDDLILSLDGQDINAQSAVGLSNKLTQMANGAVYGDQRDAGLDYIPIHERKLDALEDLIEAVNGKPILVAYWFNHDLNRIEERLHKRHIPFSKLDTADSIKRWNNGELPVALVHPASAGHVNYDVWKKQDFLQTTEGNVVHYGYIEQFIEALGEKYNIREIAFDRWGAVQMTQNLETLGFSVVPFGQGFKDMSPPTKELMKLTLEEKLAHGGHPVLRWMMDNIYIRTDPAGNIKADKEKSTEKIDGAVATIMALDRAIRCGNDTGESVYDKRGLLVF